MSRGKYWIGMSCVFGSFLIILVILDMLSGTSPCTVLIPWWLVTRVIVFNISVKRLHDFNATGWWLLVNELVLPPIGAIIIGIIPGTKGDNKYGPEPKKIRGLM
jgi:uncharacterized membrane protein YhaH (DUF805 family)